MNTDASDARPWIEAARGRVDSIVALRAGAGRRRYWRATHADGGTSVLGLSIKADVIDADE